MRPRSAYWFDMLSFLRRIIEKRRHLKLAELVDELYGECPSCGCHVGDHLSAHLASARPDWSGTRFAHLEAAITDHDWASAADVQEFVGTEDARAFELLKCPATGQLVLFDLASYYEPFDLDYVVEKRLLTGAAAASAESFCSGRWIRVDQRYSTC